MRPILVAFLLTAVLCAGVLTLPDLAPAECAHVSHEVTLLREGTRSEAQQGWLVIDCVLLPDTFSPVVVNGQEYAFYQRDYLWGQDGYFPTGQTVEPILGKGAVSDEDLAQGWYLGREKLENTPDNWIYVEWMYGQAWVAPESVGDLVRAEAIENIERDRVLGDLMPTEGVRQEMEPESAQ